MLTPTALLTAIVEDGHWDIDYASEYAEPGYTPGKRGILFADWNDEARRGTDAERAQGEYWPKVSNFRSRVATILEKAGFECEWSDEWSTCGDCGKAVRTSGDSYSWTPSFALLNECELVCHECIRDDPIEYLEELIGDSSKADTLGLDLTEHGFVQVNADAFESGWHPGQTDDPAEIAKNLPFGRTDFIFQLADVGQFDVRFNVFVREEMPT